MPLDAINAACGREKSIRHGHPSTLHLWWARRPLAAARAVIFAQLVNDPGFQHGGGFRYGMNKRDAAIERQRLFKIVEDLVQWENSAIEEVLERARAEIRRSWREVCDLNKGHPQAAELFDPNKLPALHDPFAGGGALPLEAQRLGLEVTASDLNPVAVAINKAMIEIPPRFVARFPVGADVDTPKKSRRLALPQTWTGTTGLAEDVRRYAAWFRKEAEKRIGALYPLVEVSAEAARDRPSLKSLVGRKFVPIAYIWARTVRSPNPAFANVEVPLVSSFVLSSKPGKESYIQPVVKGGKYFFTVTQGAPPLEAAEGTKASGRGANFRCLVSDAPISADYIKAEAQAGRMRAKLMAVVIEDARSRVYLAPTPSIEAVAQAARPAWKPDVEFFQQALGFRVGNYGMSLWSDLFTVRQLAALGTFSDLVLEARERVRRDALAAGLSDDETPLSNGGTGAYAYADAVTVNRPGFSGGS
jgi:putative DNA methylase